MKGWGLRHLAQIQPCSAGGAGADSPLLTPPLEQEGWENLLETIQDMIVLDTPGLCRDASKEIQTGDGRGGDAKCQHCLMKPNCPSELQQQHRHPQEELWWQGAGTACPGMLLGQQF
ncbi:hypothetical protein TURU_115963 [Turdus rufiventris]|nr:hypothetical protein TURU_115963 [Turdus rufiventris]